MGPRCLGALSALLASLTACGGSSGESLAERGCPADPTCADLDRDGELCLGPCDAQCRRTHLDFGLWVSVYEVAGTGGWGRHNGLALFGARRVFDERFRLAEDPELQRFAWPPAPYLPELPRDVEDVLLGEAEAFEDHAMCAPPVLHLDRALYDHGRALAREPEYQAHRVALALVHGDSLDDVDQCLGRIQDGYCDTICGNCSYVLPSLVVADSRSGDWSEESSRVWGEPGCSGDEAYYGSPGEISRPSLLGSTFANPFTHCAWHDCGDSYFEAPTLDSYGFLDEAMISGLYGHNSNSDAEAAYRAFQHCADPVSWPDFAACAACGDGEGGRQSPCAAGSNSASHYWQRTATAGATPTFEDLYPVIGTDYVPPHPPPAGPTCRWAPFQVRGM